MKKIEKEKTKALKPIEGAVPAELIRAAIEGKADLEKLERLLDIQLRWEASEAKKAYVAAMAQFKADPPKIEKDRHVEYQTRGGDTVKYNHATLANITEKINQSLSQHDLSAAWETNQEVEKICVTCKITHIMGHSEKTMICCNADLSGGKNAIQAIGSAISYLQRYTLLALTGLATYDMDDDGASIGDNKEKTISASNKQQSSDEKSSKKESDKSEAGDIPDDPITDAQVILLINSMIDSRLLLPFEKYRLASSLFNDELGKKKASATLNWWLGNAQTKQPSEREKREQVEKDPNQWDECFNEILNRAKQKYPDQYAAYEKHITAKEKDKLFNLNEADILLAQYEEKIGRKLTQKKER